MRKNEFATANDYFRAFQALEEKGIHESHKALLTAHFNAPDHTATWAELAETVGFASGKMVNTNAYITRGEAWANKREYDKAIADYTQAIRLDPTNNANPYADLSWLYATCPDPKYRDGKKALANANKAYQLNGGKWWGCFDNLAAAYAECGDFDKAKEREEKAIELAKTDKSATEKDKADAASHLESYKQGKPWREKLEKK